MITNVSGDHLGDYGIDDVPTMARVKAVVGRDAKDGGARTPTTRIRRCAG